MKHNGNETDKKRLQLKSNVLKSKLNIGDWIFKNMKKGMIVKRERL